MSPALEVMQGPLSLDAIERLEGASLELPPEFHREHEIDLKHDFAPGYYLRKIIVPADTFLIGHYQKTGFMNFMLRGRVRAVVNGELKEFVGPCVLYSTPGQRKIGYVIEEMEWLTVHPNPTEETDIAKIEDMLLIKSDTFLAHEAQLAAERVKASLAAPVEVEQ